MKIKRVFAYIIDMLIVYLISAIILAIPAINYDTEEYMNYYKEYTEIITSTEETTDEVIEKQNELTYKMTYLAKNSLVIQAITTFGYFGIAAYLMKGQTIGKKLQRIKVVSNDDKEMNQHLFILRSVILTNLIPQIASIIAIFTLKQNNWIIAETIIGNISLVISFALILVLIFRTDERSLHDIICKTKVIEVPKVIKESK